MKLNEWKETELFDMLMEKFVPKAKKDLPGNQEVLDVDDDGKITGKDFKKLRSKKKPENEITKKDILNLRGVPLKDEETEESDEETEKEKIEESPDETGYWLLSR